MPVRSQTSVEDALLDYLFAAGTPVKPKDTYEPLARGFNLSAEERVQTLTSRDGNAWENLIQWARQRLVVRGLVDRSTRGIWTLTEAGISAAEQRSSEASSFASPDYIQDGAEPFIEAEEGLQKLRSHLVRERSKTLVEAFKSKLQDLSCTACQFDFTSFYGDLGRGYIEAHHIVPVSTLKPGQKTQLHELVAVCSNCHRIIHRNGLISVDKLRKHLRRNQ